MINFSSYFALIMPYNTTLAWHKISTFFGFSFDAGKNENGLIIIIIIIRGTFYLFSKSLFQNSTILQ